MSAGGTGPWRTIRPTRVLVVGDRELRLRRLARHIASHPGFEIVGVTADARVARDLSRLLSPDIALVGTGTPGLRHGMWRGLGGEPGAGVPLILLSAAPAQVFGAGCGRIGAVTALPWDLPPADLLRAIADAVAIA